MKFIAKACFAQFWFIVLFTGMSLVSVSSISSAITIGENHGGGIVFYVDESGQHGLIAAKTDLPGHSSHRHEGCFSWDDANAACSNLVSNGFSDWFLPNKEQLNQLHHNRSVVGGFANNYYWSSSEGSKNNAWCQRFNNWEYQTQIIKSAFSLVRAVRAF